MDVILTSNHIEYKEQVKNCLSENISRIENSLSSPENIVKSLNQAGISVPHFVPGKSFINTLLVDEELAKVNVDLSVHHSVYITLSDVLTRYLPEKIELFHQLKSGEKFIGFSYLLDLSGQLKDMVSLKQENGKYKLNGSMNYLIYPDIANYFLVFAKEEESGKVSAFLVDREKLGEISIQEQEGSIVSKAGKIDIADLELEEADLVGTYGSGNEVLNYLFNELMLLTSAGFLGIAQNSYEASMGFVKEIKPFESNFIHSQGIHFNIADNVVELSGMRLLVLKAGYLRSNNREYTKEALRARIMTSKMAHSIINRANYIKSGFNVKSDLVRNITEIYRLEDFFVPMQQAKLLLAEKIINKDSG